MPVNDHPPRSRITALCENMVIRLNRVQEASKSIHELIRISPLDLSQLLAAITVDLHALKTELPAARAAAEQELERRYEEARLLAEEQETIDEEFPACIILYWLFNEQKGFLVQEYAFDYYVEDLPDLSNPDWTQQEDPNDKPLPNESVWYIY